MKTITLNKKNVNKINSIVSKSLCLLNTEEFRLYQGDELFNSPPENWCNLEKAICDYTARIHNEIMENFKKEFKIG